MFHLKGTSLLRGMESTVSRTAGGLYLLFNSNNLFTEQLDHVGIRQLELEYQEVQATLGGRLRGCHAPTRRIAAGLRIQM